MGDLRANSAHGLTSRAEALTVRALTEEFLKTHEVMDAAFGSFG